MQFRTPLAQAGRGFVMGSADIVPGVSGGTIALVLGIYERLIHNIREGARALRQILTGHWSHARTTIASIEWVWLVSLLVGILTAVAVLSSLLERLLDDEPVKMAALFLGLVAGSIWITVGLIDRVDAVGVALVAGVGLGMFLLLGLRSDTAVADDALEIVTEPAWIFFISGAIAISAMILPGISGSFILVLLGMYTEVLGAVNDREIASLVAFTLGCVVGLAVFSTLLNWLLERYHSWVIAAMLGLMLGSTRVLWPWPNGTNTTELAAPTGDIVIPILLGLVGFGGVVAIGRISRAVMSPDPHATETSPTPA